MTITKTTNADGDILIYDQREDGTIITTKTTPEGRVYTVTQHPDESVTDESNTAQGLRIKLGDKTITNDSTKVYDAPVYTTQKNEPTVEKKKKNDIKTLQFPLKPENSHYVRFYINIDQESKLIRNKSVEFTDVDQTDQNRVRRGPFSQQSADAAIVLGAAASSASAFSQTLTKTFSLKGLKGRALSIGTGLVAGAAVGATAAYVANNVLDISKRLKRLKTSITLFSPQGISANYGMSYDTTNDQFADILQSDKSDSIIKAIESGKYTQLGSKILRIVATGANDTVSSITRSALNPKVDVLFRDVNNRQFTFNFQFMPKSSDEAMELAKIIYQFKFFAHPEILKGFENYLFLYPAEFDIEYGMRDESGAEVPNIFLNKISSCVLQNINVEYAPNGNFQSLQNGEPIQTNLSLSFKEIEMLHQGRIEEGM